MRKGSMNAAAVVMFLVCSGTTWADAGRVTAVTGLAYAERDVTVNLRPGDTIFASDTLRTGRGSTMQVEMADGDVMTLRPLTSLRVDQYQAPPGTAGPPARAFYSLLRGGFRAVARIAGARDLDHYRVQTPVATMGIRGTSYEMVMTEQGLYISVDSGRITVFNPAGQIEIGAGQSVFIAGPNVPPVLSAGPPPTVPDGTTGGLVGGAATASRTATIVTAATIAAITAGLFIAILAEDDAAPTPVTPGT